MKTYLLSPRLSLVDAIADELVCEARDFSRNLVVFPGKRPAHYLRKAVAARAGGAHLPPVVLSMDEFIDRAFESVDERPKIDPLDAVALLYDIHCSMNQRIGGKDFRALDSFFSVGLKLYHDLEELVIEQVTAARIRDISALAEETIPELSNQRIASTEHFYERFYKRIETEALSTRSVRYRTVAERLEETDTNNYIKIIFAGFFALTVSEKMIFRKLANWENVGLYFQDGPHINETLSQLEAPPEKMEAEEGFPSVEFMSSPDTHGQVFALADMIKPLRDKGCIDENIAVVLPSADTLFPLLRHGLPDFNDREFNISMGYPLSRTPLFGFVRELMELITGADDGRIHIAEYLAFALHPYTKNIYFDGSAETTRIIFHAVEEYYAQRPSKSFITLDEIESDNNLIALIMKMLPEDLGYISDTDALTHIRNIHSKTLRPFFEILNVTDFSLKLVGLLTYIAGQSTAGLHPLFMPFCEAFIEALELIAKSRLGEKRFEEKAGYFTLFSRYLMTRRAPFEGTPLRGLQALGMLETRNIKFDRVFLLDANEDILPDTKREDSLIPGAARELLGLSTYRDRDRLAAYYFDVMIKGASAVNIFFVESSQREKSRFVEKILWETQQRKGSIRGDRAVQNLQYLVNLVNLEPEPVCKSAEIAGYLRGLSYSASAIDTYLSCPLKFYYRYALKLTEKDEAGDGIERSDIGLIVHEALAGYFKSRMGRPLNERDIDADEIAERAKRIFEESYGGVPTGSAYLIMKQIQKRLADYLGNYLTALLKEGDLTMLEAEVDMKAPFHDFILRGRIDAAQKRKGRIHIIDYKTSANKGAYKIAFDKLDPDQRETWSAIGSMQLPVYRILYAHERNIERTKLNAMFLMLGMTKMNRDIELPLFKEEWGTAETESAVIDEILFRLLKEITDPAVPFHPTPDKKKNCSICDFTAICGTQWVQR
jgi:ATP-dependent helicase/nuclease subunit B